jgi:hypothetical protein
VFARRHGWQNTATMRLVITAQSVHPISLTQLSSGNSSFITQALLVFTGQRNMAGKGCHQHITVHG